MTANKKTAIVVAPGRGTYGKGELGSIARLHGARFADLIADFDAQRRARGQPTVSELDGADRFSVATHMRGAVAAPLIYAATLLDWLSIDRERYDVVAALGNSMGWYSALAIGGAVSVADGFRIANAMGLEQPGARAGRAGYCSRSSIRTGGRCRGCATRCSRSRRDRRAAGACAGAVDRPCRDVGVRG